MNGINLALPVLICSDANQIEDDNEISLRLDDGIVINHIVDEQHDTDALSEFRWSLVDSGRFESYTQQKFGIK